VLLKLLVVSYKKFWARSHSAFDQQYLRSATNKCQAAIIKAKHAFHASSVSSNITNPRKLWTTVNKILHCKSSNSLPSCPDSTSLSNSFAYFISYKIHKIHINLLPDTSRTTHHIPCPHILPKFDFFMPALVDEISKLINEFNDTYSDLDPIPSSLHKKCKFALLPTITNIINYSLAFGIFPDQFKSCSVHPLLKKPTCDKDDLSYYRPISHSSFLSKLTERVVKNRLTHFISDNNLLNSSQSAYTKYRSTETTLLAVHDHVIRAISQQNPYYP
jgi:hypothetical protein